MKTQVVSRDSFEDKHSIQKKTLLEWILRRITGFLLWGRHNVPGPSWSLVGIGLKEFLNFSFPVRKGFGSFHLNSTRFFCAFVFVMVLFLYELKKRTRPAEAHDHVEFLRL